MSLWQTTRNLASLWAENKKIELQQRGQPDTRVDSGGTRGNYSFSGQEIDRDELRDVRDMRESGGIISHLVHAKSVMQFGTGASFQAEEDEAAEWLQDQFNDLDNLLINIGEDATWFPYANAELVETRGGDFSHVECVEPWTMLPVENEYGEVIAWEQQIKGDWGATTEAFEPDEIATFILNKSSGRDKTGVSEVLRAEDEVRHFKENQKTINDALEFLVPHNHWKVGREGGTVIDDNELRRVRNMVQDMEGDTQFITGRDVDHEAIDLPKFDVKEITNNDLRQVCVALGVPIELASVISEGLGSGEQSGVRQDFFELEKRAKQRALGGQFVEQVARPLLEQYSPYDPEQQLDLVFDETETVDEKKTVVDSIGDSLTNNEKRELFDYAPLDDDEKGEAFDSPGESSDESEGMGGLFASALTDGDVSKVRALEDGFDATLFELVATEEQEDFETGARLGVGVEFPNSGVYVDWNIDAWPEEERLDGPHVSDYATIEDAQKVAQGEVRELAASELAEGGRDFRGLSGAPEWDAHLIDLQSRVWDMDPDKALFSVQESEVPEFVKQRIRDAIDAGALFSNFDDIESSRLMELRSFFKDELTDDGWTLNEVRDNLMEFEPSLSKDEAETLARTETSAVLNKSREIGYEERGDGDVFYWSGALDGRHTDACEWLIEETNPKYGGDPVELDELKELIDEAPSHDPEMQDDLARPDDFVVHPNERKTFVRAVEGAFD